MALNIIHLRKLLRLFMAAPSKRKSLLREMIRSDLRKAADLDDGGGDFYMPFWAAAKDHVKGKSNLSVRIPILIAANKGRRKLYPIMQKSFLEWWTQKRAWRNEPFSILDSNVWGRLDLADLSLTLKVDHVLARTIGDLEHRLVYPYFSNDTRLSLDGARLGIYLLSKTLPDYPIEAFRILDVVIGVSFSINDCPLTGTEFDELSVRFRRLEEERSKLLEEYV